MARQIHGYLVFPRNPEVVSDDETPLLETEGLPNYIAPLVDLIQENGFELGVGSKEGQFPGHESFTGVYDDTKGGVVHLDIRYGRRSDRLECKVITTCLGLPHVSGEKSEIADTIKSYLEKNGFAIVGDALLWDNFRQRKDLIHSSNTPYDT